MIDWFLETNPIVIGLCVWPIIIIIQNHRKVLIALFRAWPWLSVAMKGFAVGVASGIIYEVVRGRKRNNSDPSRSVEQVLNRHYGGGEGGD